MHESQHISEVLPQMVIVRPESTQIDNYSNKPIVNGKYPDGTFAPENEYGSQIEEIDRNQPHSDQSNLPPGKYRTLDGRLLFANGNEYGGGRPAGGHNNATPWFNGIITDAEVAKLETMSKPELIRLLKTLGGVVGYALKNPEEKAEAAELKLYGLGMQANEAHKVIPALKEWYDRTKGKPAQSIQMTVKDEGLDKLATDKLLRLAQMLDEPVVISPMPKKLEE